MKEIGRKPRRIAVAVIFVVVIAIMWTNRDIFGLWNGISAKDLFSLMAENWIVIAIRIAVFAGIVYFIRKTASKKKRPPTDQEVFFYVFICFPK